MDTIFALASGSMRAGVAVIRVSGPDAQEGLAALTRRKNHPPRKAVFSALRDESGKELDRALTLYFQGPASFTGEDVVEYHLHGGRAVIESVLACLGRRRGCRHAEPGEFTKRAFLNGKLDLTEAEAVADLIAAETQAQRAQALEQLGGGLAKIYQDWATRLTQLLAHQEADIEFPDEDMPAGVSGALQPKIQELLQEIRTHLSDGRRGERLRAGLHVAILGAPNAGKSSLLNTLAQRDVAIVSPEAGTTRDIIEVHLDLGGYPVILADTAGLRAAAGTIEEEGIRRARNLAREADLKIVLFDGSVPRDVATEELVDAQSIVVSSKCDLGPRKSGAEIPVSTRTGEGLEKLIAALTQKATEIFGGKAAPTLTRARHREALEETAACLERGLEVTAPELAAEDLRLALRALGRVTGRVHVEEILDRVFKDFCIGK